MECVPNVGPSTKDSYQAVCDMCRCLRQGRCVCVCAVCRLDRVWSRENQNAIPVYSDCVSVYPTNIKTTEEGQGHILLLLLPDQYDALYFILAPAVTIGNSMVTITLL